MIQLGALLPRLLHQIAQARRPAWCGDGLRFRTRGRYYRLQSIDGGGDMVMTEILGGLGGLKTLKDLFQALDASRTKLATDDIKRQLNEGIIEAQATILALQQQAATLLNRKDELEKEVVELKDWKAEANTYEPADTGQGSLAYRRKAAMKDAEPPHWLCPNCFHQQKKSFLQPETGALRVQTLRCHPCGQQIITRGNRADAFGRGGR